METPGLNESFDQRWARAQDKTIIHRTRKNDLYTFGATALPYTFVARSAINPGDSIIRRGEVKTEKPALFLGEAKSKTVLRVFPMRASLGMLSCLPELFAFPNLNVSNSGMSMEVVTREIHGRA